MKRRDLIAGGVALSLASRFKRAGAAEAEAKAAGPLVLGGHIGPVFQLAYSPDGRWLVSSAAQLNEERVYIGGQTLLWDARAGKLERVLLPDIQGQKMQWSHDGHTLALPGLRWQHGGGSGSVQLWDTSDADASKWESRHMLAEANASAVSVLSPDGKYFISGIDDRATGGAIIWDVASGQQLARLGEQSGFLAASCFAPDGKTLFTVSWRGQGGKFEGSALQWWDTDGAPGEWELKRVLQMPDRIADMALSPDGKSLLWARWQGGMDSCILVLADAESGELKREINREGWLLSPQWSPDGSLVAASAVVDAKDADKRRAQAHVFDTRDWSLKESLGDGKRLITALAFAPDGSSLALGSGDRAVEIYKLVR